MKSLVIFLSGLVASAVIAGEKMFHFPEPLQKRDGTQVKSKEEWTSNRLPELRELFQTEMYGRYPEVKTTVTGKTVYENTKAFDGLATLREVEVDFGIKGCPSIYVLLVLPNKRPATGAPTFIGLNFDGNHAHVDDKGIRITTGYLLNGRKGVKNNRATEEGRGSCKSMWPLEQIVQSGYAVATCFYGEISEDHKETKGPLAPYVVDPRLKEHPTCTESIMLWAWGLHRITDYIETLPELDKKRFAVVGHSRLGKAALLAGAFDSRFAVVIPNQAGCGGSGPSRHSDPKAESVKRINTAFPHWFSEQFKKYNDALDQLPIDQHLLLAMCAPRAVLYTNAEEDLWANPTGQFEMMKLTNPVYSLFGSKGTNKDKRPELLQLNNEQLGYWIRPGKHELNPDDWATFITYANRWMK